MLAAKVIDNIWSTRKDPSLTGLKFMIVELLDTSAGNTHMIVADIMGAGIGERVIVVQGSAARRMIGNDDIPVDAAIIGIIDEECKK